MEISIKRYIPALIDTELWLGALHTNTVKLLSNQGLFLDTQSKKIMKSPRSPLSIGNVKVSSVALSYTHITVFKPMLLHLALDRCVSLGFC